MPRKRVNSKILVEIDHLQLLSSRDRALCNHAHNVCCDRHSIFELTVCSLSVCQVVECFGTSIFRIVRITRELPCKFFICQQMYVVPKRLEPVGYWICVHTGFRKAILLEDTGQFHAPTDHNMSTYLEDIHDSHTCKSPISWAAAKTLTFPQWRWC